VITQALRNAGPLLAHSRELLLNQTGGRDWSGGTNSAAKMIYGYMIDTRMENQVPRVEECRKRNSRGTRQIKQKHGHNANYGSNKLTGIPEKLWASCELPVMTPLPRFRNISFPSSGSYAVI